MLQNPDCFIAPFIKAGAETITVHVEADHDVAKTLNTIKDSGIQAGIAMNPDCDPKKLLPYIDSVDLVLCMTVFPGFGGQSFIPSVLQSIQFLDNERKKRGLKFRLEVDGGINTTTGLQCRAAGADTLVAGTAFYKATDRRAFIAEITA
jgi:ribulose-phosphate 3-epimerase